MNYTTNTQFPFMTDGMISRRKSLFITRRVMPSTPYYQSVCGSGRLQWSGVAGVAIRVSSADRNDRETLELCAARRGRVFSLARHRARFQTNLSNAHERLRTRGARRSAGAPERHPSSTQKKKMRMPTSQRMTRRQDHRPSSNILAAGT